MTKVKVMNEKFSIAEWANSLKNITDEQWFKPFRVGSWGTADVISHLISWDHFMINERIAYILKNEPFPASSTDIQSVNDKASEYARSGVSKEDLIDEFITIRKELISRINEIPEEKFSQPMPGKEHITIAQYFDAIIDHDIKHKEEIDSLIK